MVEDTISNAIMIIAVVVATAVVLNAVYPAVSQAVGSVRSVAGDADSRSKTAVTISSYSFSPDGSRLDVWMKNSGQADIGNLGGIRAYYGDGSGAMTNYAIASSQLFAADPGADIWSPGETYEISIAGNAGGPLPQGPGEHRFKVVLPDGAESEITFTL